MPLLTELGNFGYQLYTHDLGLGIGHNGFGVYGRKNAKFVPDPERFLSREYFESFGRHIPKEKVGVVNYAGEIQMVQVTTLPIELLVVETRYKRVEVQERAKGLRGLLGGKTERLEIVSESVKKLYRTLEVLEKAEKDEPAYVTQWAVPWFWGFGFDKRPGMVFIFSTLMGKSDITTVSKAIQDEPRIVRETGEFLFPDLFSALEKGVPYKQLPHYLLEKLPLSERNLRKIVNL